MTEQEQIEEMAKCMGEKNFLCADDCENCIQIPCKCKLVKQSKLLYKAGYRKASDMIDEFENKVKQFILENCCVTDDDVDAIWKGLQKIAAEMRREFEK